MLPDQAFNIVGKSGKPRLPIPAAVFTVLVRNQASGDVQLFEFIARGLVAVGVVQFSGQKINRAGVFGDLQVSIGKLIQFRCCIDLLSQPAIGMESGALRDRSATLPVVICSGPAIQMARRISDD